MKKSTSFFIRKGVILRADPSSTAKLTTGQAGGRVKRKSFGGAFAQANTKKHDGAPAEIFGTATGNRTPISRMRT